jgi:hypothetical protein
LGEDPSSTDLTAASGQDFGKGHNAKLAPELCGENATLDELREENPRLRGFA